VCYHFFVNQNISDAANIALSIDEWEDLFDDFDSDPSNFSNRTISDDFLDALELRYSSKNRGDFKKITIHAPKSMYDPDTEKTVLSRLHEQIQYRYSIKQKETRSQIVVGGALIVTGITFFFVKEILALRDQLQYFGDIICWLGIWEGSTKIYDSLHEHMPALQFFNKIVSAEMVFVYK
jgi:hypothetical protein